MKWMREREGTTSFLSYGRSGIGMIQYPKKYVYGTGAENVKMIMMHSVKMLSSLAVTGNKKIS